jgi:tRNA A-37 threonylcarbamoyl transferase component Bud32
MATEGFENDGPGGSSGEYRLEEAILAYEQEVDAGRPPDPEEFLGRHADLAEGLRAYFGDVRSLAPIMAPLRASSVGHFPEPGTPETTGHGAAEKSDDTTGLEGPPGPTVEERRRGDDWPEIPGYEILEELGKGGMGMVYRARHHSLDRVVALKMLRSGELSDPSELRRFTAEARAMARLDHPHVVPIYEVGEHQRQPYFTMKLLVGGSLHGHLERFRTDPRRAVELAEKVARAVHYLHEHKILHRDLKPLNILLDEHDEPFVSDFGLAKFLECGQDLTVEGTVLGTLPYMAPEQARGQTHLFSPRTEVWTLGVILYELLTGRRPFAAQDRTERTRLILAADFPPPRSVRPEIDPALESILLRCLQPAPADRYASAGALAEDLGRWLRGESTQGLSAPPLRRCWRRLRRHPVFCATGVLCVITGMALATSYLLEGPGDTTPSPRAVRPATPARTLIGETGRPKQNWRWVVRGEGTVEDLAQDGTFFLRSPTFSLLELGTALPWPRYRLEAEVRHDESGKGGVGIYFARTKHETARGIHHRFCRLAFADELRLRGGIIELEFDYYRLAGGGVGGVMLGSHSFPPAPAQGPKPWRKLIAEVSADSLDVEWEGTPLVQIPGPRIRAQAARLAEEGERDPWGSTSRGGFGLYVNQGAASFRRVVVTPLPHGR